MADEADVGNDNAELFLQSALSNRAVVSMKPAGRCYYCDESVKPSMLFCPGSECRDDWQREDRLRRIIGRSQGRS